MMKKGKILFCASAGGHYSELLQLGELIKKYNGVIVTEKTDVSKDPIYPTEYVMYCSGKMMDGFICLSIYGFGSFHYFILSSIVHVL